MMSRSVDRFKTQKKREGETEQRDEKHFLYNIYIYIYIYIFKIKYTRKVHLIGSIRVHMLLCGVK